MNVRELRAVTVLVLPLAVLACDRFKKKPVDTPDPVDPVASTAPPVPPAMPLNAFLDAAVADPEGKPPFEQSKAYYQNGQVWMARLVLENKALGSTATKDETLFLANICHEQEDQTCVDACAKKLGQKLKWDGGVSSRKGVDTAGLEHKEPDSDLARARDFVLKTQYAKARALLEPKVLDGSASPEETKMLKLACEKQGDKMCVALCNSKLK